MKQELRKAIITASIGVTGVLILTLFTGQADIFRRARMEISQYIDATEYRQGGVTYDLSTLGGGGSRHTIKDEGTARTDRANINFIGGGVSATDNAGTSATDVTIPADAVSSVNSQTGAVSLDTDDIAEGAAKYNQTHTGEITGATALTLGKTAISNRSTATPATGDSFMFGDVSDSDNLKRATLADILALISGLTDSQISDTLTASKVIGSGSSTDNVDAGTAELAGTVPYTKGGTGLTTLGTANQVLRTNAGATAVEWATPSTGGDPTYGSNAGASDDSVYVDATNEVGIGTTTPSENLDIYATDNAPRIALRYYNAGGSGTDIDYAQSGTDSSAVGVIAAWYGTDTNLSANDANYKAVNNAIPGGDNKLTHYLLAKDYPIDIPTGATVDGIEFVVNGQYSEDDTPHACDDTYIRIIKGGTVQTIVNRASGTTWPQSSETTRTYGGPTDLWGTTWTESDVEADTFGLAMAFTMDDNDAMNIDYVTVKIYYTAGVAGDYTWTSGVDLSDGAWTLRADATDWIRVNYTTGLTEFPGVIDVDGIKQDGVLYDLSTFGAGGGDVVGPASGTDNAIPRYDTGTGKLLQNSTVLIDDSGNVTLGTGDTVDGREISTDGAKLDGIAPGATANTGTVTSVAVTPTDGLTVSGSPVTTSGTFTFGVDTLAFYLNMGTHTAHVTPATGDTILIGDASNSYEMEHALVGDFVLAPSSTDNRIPKFLSTGGQLEVSGVSIDDSNNISGAGTYNGVNVGAIVSNATHTGEVTGSTGLTLDKTAITNRTNTSPATGDGVLLTDASASDALIRTTIADILALISGLTDSQISDTLTSSIFKGTGTASDAVDLGTAEVAGDLPFANVTQIAQYETLGRVAGSTGDVKALSRVEQDTMLEVESELTSSSNATAWNSDSIRYFHDTLTQNTTVSASSGTLRTNQYVQFRFTAATGADYTLAWNSLFAAGSGSPFAGTIPAMNTTDGRDSVYLFQYRGSKLWLAAYREDN